MEETDQRKESNRAIAQNTYVVVHNHSILKPLTAQTYKKMRTKEEAFEDFATSPNPNSFPRFAQRPPHISPEGLAGPGSRLRARRRRTALTAWTTEAVRTSVPGFCWRLCRKAFTTIPGDNPTHAKKEGLVDVKMTRFAEEALICFLNH